MHNDAILLTRFSFIPKWKTMCLYLCSLDINNINPGNFFVLHSKNNYKQIGKNGILGK